MNNCDYEVAIASIISDFRYSELGKRWDSNHVHCWIGQFIENDRGAILAETFHILSRTYYKKDKLTEFYKRVLNCLAKENPLDTYSFICNQEKGCSQKTMLSELERLATEMYSAKLNTCVEPEEAAEICIYIDDGLYTGRRIRDDLSRFLDNAKNKRIIVFLIVSYSNNLHYCQSELEKQASKVTAQ